MKSTEQAFQNIIINSNLFRDVIILYDTLSFFFLRILGIEDGDKELT